MNFDFLKSYAAMPTENEWSTFWYKFKHFAAIVAIILFELIDTGRMCH